MHEVLVNRLGDLSLPRKSVVRLTDRPDMTLDVYCGCKTTIQQQQQSMTTSAFLKQKLILKFFLILSDVLQFTILSHKKFIIIFTLTVL